MRVNQRFARYPLIALAVLVVGCEQMPEPEPPDRNVASRPERYLVCDATTPADTTAAIDQAGGTLMAGPHRLELPERAVPSPVDFTLSAPADTLVRVVVSRRQPGRLRRSAVLTLDFSHCTAEQIGNAEEWFIWRFPSQNANAGWRLGTILDGTTVRAHLGETSMFVIAH